MKKPKNELKIFVAGIVMLVAGLFILSQKVVVYSSFFSGMSSMWGMRISSGMVIIPLIIGIIWMFMTNSFASKVFSALAGLLIVIAVILSTNIRLTSMTLFDWILILVLIFGGLGFIGRVLLAERNDDAHEITREDVYKELYENSLDDKSDRKSKSKRK